VEKRSLAGLCAPGNRHPGHRCTAAIFGWQLPLLKIRG
jgi:hypothetical protein